MVVEQAEPAVQPHIDRGGLEHLWIIGVEDDTGGVELGADVAIGEEHGSIVPSQLSYPSERRSALLALTRKARAGALAAGGRTGRAPQLDRGIPRASTPHGCEPGCAHRMRMPSTSAQISIPRTMKIPMTMKLRMKPMIVPTSWPTALLV